MSTSELVAKLMRLQEQMIAAATYNNGDEDLYRRLRAELLQSLGKRNVLPDFVSKYLSLEHFRTYMQETRGGYKDRRMFIWDAFKECFEKLEVMEAPLDAGVIDTLAQFDPEHVAEVWRRARDRRETDPEGAITLARSLIESVCKYILDDLSVVHDPKEDLPKLYKLTAEAMNLAPSQHTEQVFKQILGSCQSIVDCLGTLRNRVGDAHGQGPKPVKPAPHHAELAVNLSGTMATFLVATWRRKKASGQA